VTAESWHSKDCMLKAKPQLLMYPSELTIQ